MRRVLPNRAAIAALALVPVLALIAGCSSGSKSSTTGTGTSTSAGKGAARGGPPPKPTPSSSPLPAGDAGYLTAESERAAFEAIAAGIARGRAGSASVKAFAGRMLRERGRIISDDSQLARKLKLKIERRAFAANERGRLRALVPLTGSRFDSAYLKLEVANIRGDIASADSASRTARAAQVKKLAAKHLATFRSELGAAQTASP